MARPIKNTVDYFPHYISNGKKMFYIESKYKNDGYAVWFRILEMLGSAENHYLNLNNEQDILFISARCFVSEDLLISIINDLAKVGAIDADFWKKRVIWSGIFIESIRDAYKKRNNKLLDKQGLSSLLSGLGLIEMMLPDEKEGGSAQTKLNYNKPNKTKENKIKENSLIFPFSSDKFKKVWGALLTQKKWRKKSELALQASLKKLSKFPEAVAIEMIEDAIAGEWQGVHEKPEWKKGKAEKKPISGTMDAFDVVKEKINRGEI